MFNVFVFCGGKCGGVTLAKTFTNNGYTTTHLHGLKTKGLFNTNIDVSKTIETLDLSCKHYNKVIIIDSYRTPIERKISAFFQNISLHLPDYNKLSTKQLIDYFNEKLLYNIEEYHSINGLLKHYEIPLFSNFNSNLKYNIIEKDNKIFIKIRFNEINEWGNILSRALGKKIVMHNGNLTAKKDIAKLYSNFKNNYKVPKDYLTTKLVNDTEFKVYNTEDEQKLYIKEWLEKSY